ncbi:MAG TPA: DedA family protein [Actinomycetota bacterium]|jgi:membrane protein DedA with SNARE-associated domain|nr:DedA family protein [Actinomycetota bacterium]
MDAFQDFLTRTIGDWGYLAIFVAMVLESACIPIPSEITMPFGGLMAASGDLNLWLVGLVGAVANLVGSWIAYAAGATGGRALVLRYGRYVRIRPHDLDRAEDWFKRYGDRAVFWSRLLPVVRTFISLPAGMARMELVRFSVYSFVGSLPWSLGLAYGGYALGQNWHKLADNLEVAAFGIAALLVAGAAFLLVRSRRRKARAAA